MQAAPDDTDEEDAVSVMVNGKKTMLSKESYQLLNEQNQATKLQLKKEIHALLAQFKTKTQKKAEWITVKVESAAQLLQNESLEIVRRFFYECPVKHQPQCRFGANPLDVTADSNRVICEKCWVKQ